MGAWYVDTSAAAKLIVAEAHSATLRRWAVERAGELVGSDLVRTELLRFARRLDPDLLPAAQAVLDVLDIVPVTRDLFRTAGLLEPAGLRTLDALHLAAALSLGDDLEGLVTYDERLAQAARGAALRVAVPA